MFIPHEIENLLVDLGDFSIIVEGKRDKKALEGFGLENIFTISGKSLDLFSDELPEKSKYVILTDFDKEGEQEKARLQEILLRKRFVINENLRRRFKSSFRVSKIEELKKFLKIKEDVYHGKISSIDYKIFNRSKFHRKWCSREARCHWGNIWTN